MNDWSSYLNPRGYLWSTVPDIDSGTELVENKSYNILIKEEVTTKEALREMSEELFSLLLKYHCQVAKLKEAGFFHHPETEEYSPAILTEYDLLVLECYLENAELIIKLLKGISFDILDPWGNVIFKAKFCPFKAGREDFPKTGPTETMRYLFKNEKETGIFTTLISKGNWYSRKYCDTFSPITWKSLFQGDKETLRLIIESKTEDKYNYPFLMKYLSHERWAALEHLKKVLFLDNVLALLKYIDKMEGFDDPEDQITLDYLMHLSTDVLKYILPEYPRIATSKQLMNRIEEVRVLTILNEVV